MTHRTAALVLASLALAAVVVAAVRIADNGDEDRTPPPAQGIGPSTTAPPTNDVRDEIDRRLAAHPTGEPIDAATAVAALRAGTERLLRSPAIDLRYDVKGSAPGSVTASGIVRPDAGALEVRRTTTLEGGGILAEERRVVDGVVYVRTDDGMSDVPSPWDRGPVEPGPTTDADRALAGGGAAGASLGGIADLVAGAPFVATRASTDRGTTYRLRLPAERLLESFRGRPDATIAFEFTVGPDDVLTALAAYGTVLEDGELLEPVEPLVVDIHYVATSPRPIQPPPTSDLRTP
jgi:hypothetical protein